MLRSAQMFTQFLPFMGCAVHFADARNGYTVTQHCRALELVEQRYIGFFYLNIFFLVFEFDVISCFNIRLARRIVF